MRNTFKILRRDALRLIRVPAAWVIIIGLSVIPSLYAWFNIVGFWDPYGNTKSIEVSVANDDAGASTDLMGTLDLGSQIVSQLKSNDQLGWKFTSKKQAMEDVTSGASYAAIIIPQSFSTDVASITTGTFTQPELTYVVNEKLSAIAPKVTDVGASTLDTQVNETFVKTASEVIASTLKTKLSQAETDLDDTRVSLASGLGQARTKLADAQKRLSDVSTRVDTSRTKVSSAHATLADTTKLLRDASATATSTGTLLTDVATSGGAFASQASTAFGKGSAFLSQASSSLSTTVTGFSTKALAAQGTVAAGLGQAQGLAATNADTLKTVTDTVTSSTLLPQGVKTDLLATLSRLATENTQNATLLQDLAKTNDGLGTSLTGLSTTANGINDAVQTTTSATDSLRQDLTTRTIPSLTSGLTSLSASSGQLAGGLAGQVALVDQASTALDDLDGVLANTSDALDTLATTLGDLSDDLGTVSTDISALGSTGLWENLMGLDGFDADKMSDFMASPTELEQKTVFPVPTYGSAMAPLFTNLALWIGAFALVVILKLEVDDEGIENLTRTQAYMGRWLLLAGFSIAQALIVTIGDLIIGVQTVNPVAFVLTGVLVALAFLSIIYALAQSFSHVGKGLAVLLVMVQIPGASGLYPIEMMPDFFRALYPLLPFTYGIDAMRETIGGFYNGYYAQALLKLGVFVAIAFFLGLVVRRYLINVNWLFAKELDDTEIFVSEKTLAPRRRFRLSQIIRALVDKDEFEQSVLARARRFEVRYPRLRLGALVVGFVVPAILVVISSFSWNSKPVVIGLWVLWILVIIGYLIAVEYVKESITSQISLGSMPEEDLRSILQAKYARHGAGGRRRFAAAGVAEPPHSGHKPTAGNSSNDEGGAR